MSDEVLLSEEDLDLVNELRHLRAEKSSLEREIDSLRKQILQRLDGATRGVTAAGGSPAVKIRVQTRTTVSTDKLRALYPDVYEDVIRETEVTYVETP